MSSIDVSAVKPPISTPPNVLLPNSDTPTRNDNTTSNGNMSSPTSHNGNMTSLDALLPNSVSPNGVSNPAILNANLTGPMPPNTINADSNPASIPVNSGVGAPNASTSHEKPRRTSRYAVKQLFVYFIDYSINRLLK